MDRRGFFRNAGACGIAAAVTRCVPADMMPLSSAAAGETRHDQESDVNHAGGENGVMQGSPPSPDRQVTRENWGESQAKMRWAMQHWRELFPTHRIARSTNPSALPGASRNVAEIAFPDTMGRMTTVQRQLDRLDVNAFIVLNRGKIAFEEYRHGMKPETPHFTASIYKFIVATVIATLIDEGKLEQDQAIEAYVPELVDTALHGATVRQLLDMESGVKYGYIGPDSEWRRHNQSIGPEAGALGVPVGSCRFLLTLHKERNHGELMRYKEADPLALTWAAEKVTGKRFGDLLHERLWEAMGAEFDADATCDPLCQWTFYVSVTLRDLARWGLMCLNDGTISGRRIVSSRCFEDIRANASVDKLVNAPLVGKFMPEGVGYRSFFYHQQDSGTIAAAGAFGQFCYINQQHATVVAFFSTTPPVSIRDAAEEEYEQKDAFEHNCRLERERWHLCHEIAKAVD